MFPYKCIRNQILPCHKVGQGQAKLHHLCKPGRAHIPNATFQVPRSLAFWFQRIIYLKDFLPCDQINLYQLWLTGNKESSYEILVQMA